MQTIEATEVKQRLDAGEELYLLDVREPHENAEFNIGGQLLPLGKIASMQLEDIEDWKDKEVICYCRSGVRSMQAAQALQTYGFHNVKNLTGGMLGWKEKFA